MKLGIRVEALDAERIQIQLYSWTPPTGTLVDVSSSSTVRLSVDEAEEVAQAILAECQDLRMRWLAQQEEALNHVS